MTTFNEIDAQVTAVFKRPDIAASIRYFWINQVIKNVVAMHEVQEARDTYRGVLSAGSHYFQFPSSNKFARSLIVEQTTTKFTKLPNPMTKSELDERFPNLPNMTASYPREWAVDGDKFWIVPPTATTYTVRLHLDHYFTELSGTDTIPIGHADDLIVHRTLELLFGLHRESDKQREYHNARAEILEIKLFPSAREKTRGIMKVI